MTAAERFVKPENKQQNSCLQSHVANNKLYQHQQACLEHIQLRQPKVVHILAFGISDQF